MDSVVPELVSTIQSTSFQENPDIAHDLNPSTTASLKFPVQVDSSKDLSESNYDEIGGNDIDDPEDAAHNEGVEEDDIPFDVLKPVTRKTNLPPLPDMRFEQSYLRSIENTKSNWGVVYITIRDQVLLPLFQGTLYSLAVLGWRFWNANASVNGAGWGSRARRWWYKTNNWDLGGKRMMGSARGQKQFARQVGEVSFSVWDPASGA